MTRRAKLSQFALAAALMAALGALPGWSVAAEDTVTLKLANVVPPESSKNQANLRFAELVDQYTDGEAKIEVFPGGQLGAEMDLAQGVVLGTIDIFWGDAAAFSSFVKELNVFNTPFLFRDVEHWKAVVRGPITDALIEELEAQAAVKVVGRMQMGKRYILTRDTPVKAPDDLRGLKIRVPDVPMYTASFEALGANPTPINYNEVYLALQQGVVDGMENPAGLIRSMKFYEVTKYLTEIGWSNAVNLLVFNRNAYEQLTPEQQAAVERAGQEASLYLDELMAKEEEDNFDFFADQGMTIVDVHDRSPWLAQVEDFPEKYGERWGTPELYNQIQNYQE